MKSKLYCKILAVGIIVLFIGVAITPCIIGKEIPKLRVYNTCIVTSETNHNNGSLSGYVNDTFMNPIKGARVRVSFHNTYEEDYSDEDGYYHVTNIPICYCLKNASCSKNCYITEWVLLSIVENTTYDFILNTTNHPPNAPFITGPKSRQSVSIKANEMNPLYVPTGTHEFRFNATDPDGDYIRYHIDWGDGHSEKTDFHPSGEEVILSHTYNCQGHYSVKAKAEDTCGFFGPIGTLTIPITKNKNCGCKEVIDKDLNKLERLLDRVEIFSKLLLVLSRDIPKLADLSESLSNCFSNLDILKYGSLFCEILLIITLPIGWMYNLMIGLLQKYEDNPFLFGILMVINIPIDALMVSMFLILQTFDCLPPIP